MSDMPPTSALASEAVECGRSAPHSGAYHSATMRSCRTISKQWVRRRASASCSARSRLEAKPWLSGEAGCHVKERVIRRYPADEDLANE